MKKFFVVLAVSLASFLIGNTGVADAADFIIPKTMNVVKIHKFPSIKPGDRLVVQAGTRGPLTIVGISGAPNNPIKVINKGGKVRIDAGGNWAGILVQNCEYIRITGSGHSGTNYGFEIYNAKTFGINANKKTRHIEIDNIEIHGALIGIGSQTKAALRGKWVQINTKIHHCYVHDIGHEGMYIGSTSWQKGSMPELENVEIAYNIIKNTGWEAVQVSSANRGVNSIHDNIVTRTGISGSNRSQQKGLVFGKGTRGKMYNNWVEDAGTHGIYAETAYAGPNEYYNNHVINAGKRGVTGSGIKITTGNNDKIYKNTIVNPLEHGILIAAGCNGGEIFRNTIQNSGPGFDPIKERGYTATNNTIR